MTAAPPGERSGEVNGERGLADTALLVQQGEDHPLLCRNADLRFSVNAGFMRGRITRHAFHATGESPPLADASVALYIIRPTPGWN